MTNRSCAVRADQNETGYPFWSTEKTIPSPITPERLQARSVVPVLPRTTRRQPRQSRLERPRAARDREGRDEHLSDPRIPQPRTDHPGQRSRRQSVERRQPGAVDDPHALDRDAGGAHLCQHHACAARGRPDPAVERSEVLEEHLCDEVVAVAVHLADDRREPGRVVDGDGRRPRRRDTEPRLARHADATRDERVAERSRGEERR